MAGKRNGRLTPAQEEYLGLLRSALWGTPAAMPQDIDAIRIIAKMQRTRPMIISALLNAGWQCDNPQPLELVRKTAATHVRMDHCLANVVTTLRNGGVEPVLLKGQGLARNYLQPLLRECGDIDLYVGREQYEKACAIINGTATEQEKSEATVTKLHYGLPHYEPHIGKVFIEIHSISSICLNKKDNAIYQALANKGLSNDLVPLVFDGVTVNTPSDSFNAFYIFFHMQRHFLRGGIGLRQMCDWIRFLHTHASTIDPSFFESTLDALELRAVWNLFASIAIDYLGLPAEEMPLYQPGLKKEAELVLECIFEEGNFGKGRTLRDKGRPKGHLAGKLYSNKHILERHLMLLRLYPGSKRVVWENTKSIFTAGIKNSFNKILHR
ncbi:MAG: nucleotidyltransferase family protein [Bacteroidales bacterium]|nr:nucleotidyltransferase family protein [Bacteroidales bacterium]